MSTPNTTQMTCPKCSTAFDIEQYNVINAQTQPELREKLLNGSMFLQTCPRWTPSRRCCGSTGSIRRTGCCGSTSLRQTRF